ncbi:hypothetical protein CK203_112161 [Vitis vinifera]|uniref:Uncharacterized protein n=1 Tax=Vitis vinifera TaxID=29760 RepID=A0A438CBS0_VITVI|nr:hypothetical protein CK203_112161 [Vitis vinifera]
MKSGENKGKQGRKAKTQQNSHHPFLCEIFAQHIPLCELLLCNFQKACSRSLPKICANFTGMRTLCEFFCANFQNHALCLGEPQECEIFATTPLLHPYPPNPKPLSLISRFSCLRPEEDISAPQSSQRAAPVRAPLDAPPHLPDSAPQSRYHTRRASATPVAPTQIPPRSPPTKKAKTSEPGESSRAPRDSQSQPPPPGALDPARPLRATPIADQTFHVEAYFDHSILRQQPELRDSYRLLERQIADAFHIPYAPADPTAFRRWAPLSEWDMVRILSRGTSSQRTILRRASPRDAPS